MAKALEAKILDLLQSGKRDMETVCFRCGMCCRYGVSLTAKEAELISGYTGLAPGVFLIQHEESQWYVGNGGAWLTEAQDDLSWPETDCFYISKGEGGCFFLERDPETKAARCRIQSVKPSTCRHYAPSLSRNWCQEGLGKYWGISISPSGKLEGSQENLRAFYEFISSLK